MVERNSASREVNVALLIIHICKYLCLGLVVQIHNFLHFLIRIALDVVLSLFEGLYFLEGQGQEGLLGSQQQLSGARLTERSSIGGYYSFGPILTILISILNTQA